MSKDDKYSYFISKVSDFEEVWGLYNESWAVLGNNEKEDILPFWPEREFAIIAADELWKDYSPKSIDLSDFIEKYLVGMCKDGIKARKISFLRALSLREIVIFVLTLTLKFN